MYRLIYVDTRAVNKKKKAVKKTLSKNKTKSKTTRQDNTNNNVLDPVVPQGNSPGKYIIKCFLQKRVYKRVKEILIEWEGYDDQTWEPEKNVRHDLGAKNFKELNDLFESTVLENEKNNKQQIDNVSNDIKNTKAKKKKPCDVIHNIKSYIVEEDSRSCKINRFLYNTSCICCKKKFVFKKKSAVLSDEILINDKGNNGAHHCKNAKHGCKEIMCHACWWIKYTNLDEDDKTTMRIRNS